FEVDHRVVGVVAVRAAPGPVQATPARGALDISRRRPRLAQKLVRGAVELIREAGGVRVRLFVPSRAEWTQTAARAAGFEPVRMVAHMLLPASAPTPQ